MSARMGISEKGHRQTIPTVFAAVRRCPRLSPTRREQRDFTFRNRWRGEGRVDGCVADALHLAGVEVSGRRVGLAEQEIVL